MNCKKCGQEVDKKAVVCTGCGCKIKKPIYKKWWFWVIIVVVIAIVGSSSGDEEPASKTVDTTQKQTEEIVYESVDLQSMFDALDENAMKAEKDYQDKNVEFECRIKSFDSDGSYISVEPVTASEWNFITALCNIKNEEQEDVLIEKKVGDKITIKGKVRSIGEVLGYTIDISEIY